MERTHLAHKAEHAVDLETGAVVAVTVQGTDQGDTASSIKTLIEAAEQIEASSLAAKGRKRSSPTRGITAIKCCWISEPWACAVTSRSPIGGDETGWATRGAKRRVSKPPANSRRAGQTPAASARRTSRAAIYPPVRNRSDAMHLPAESSEHPQTRLATHGGVESRFVDANTVRCRHAAGSAGPCCGAFCSCMVARKALRNALGAS